MNAPISEDLAISFRSLKGPAWRWELALQAAATGAPAAVSDPEIAEAVKFIRLLESDKTERARQLHPTLTAAHALWHQADSQEALTILTLGDCPADEIARRLGTSEEVIRCAESLFCDLRACRQATSWIQLQVIAPALKSGNTAAAIRYRAALYGGPEVAQAVLDGDQRVALDEVQRLADLEQKLHLKAQEALELAMADSSTAVKYLGLYLVHERQCAALELRKEQFRHRVHQDLLRSRRASRGWAAAAASPPTPAERVARSPLATLRWSQRTSAAAHVEVPTTAADVVGPAVTAPPMILPVTPPGQPAQAA